MSVLLETSVGDIVIDLLTEDAPKACENFLKLCKIKYYNYAPIHTIQPNFSLQTGDPIGPESKDSNGGSSIWGVIKGPQFKSFVPEFHPDLKHVKRGTVSLATAASERDPDERQAGSQFLITLNDKLDYLDGRAAVFGEVVEGLDVLERINTAFIDENGRPLKDIRIRHTTVLDEADIPDPEGLIVPTESPVPTKAQLATVRIADDEDLDENADQETVEKLRRERDARAQALTLEMVGDLPFADVAPPENVLFVAKLNPVTQDEDLELIFSRFGKIMSCEIIRDKKTGDSLQYAFIEFSEREACEKAYFKMQDVLIDDHRIHVDFSQSVSKQADVWRQSLIKKRAGGGFGGIDHLEKKRHYRAQAEERTRDGYDIVHDGNGRSERAHQDQRERRKDFHEDRRRPRSRSPRRHRDDRDYDRDYNRPPRRRSRSPERRRRRSRDRHDERYRERHRS